MFGENHGAIGAAVRFFSDLAIRRGLPEAVGERSKKWPHAVRIEHHKNRALVWHPLEETIDGETVKFYRQAEDETHWPEIKRKVTA
jgi:hypothetical protein